jgi:DNA-binding SARP family transcriptional activator/TolB-like protein
MAVAHSSAAQGEPSAAVGVPSTAVLRLRLIGQMSASDRNGIVALPRVRKTRAVLAILAMAAPKPVLRDQITSLLWSRREREQARASLRQSVHELQEMCTTIGLPLLRTGRQQLQLDAEFIWIDVHALGHATTAQAELLDLLQGGLLEDLAGVDPAFDQWAAIETRRLQEAATALAGLLLDKQTEPGQVIACARRLVAIAPTHEVGWRRLIQAYGDAGERAAAIEAYDQCAQALVTTARTQPSEETQALIARIRDGHPGPSAGSSPHRGDLRGASDRTARRGVWLGVTVFRASDPIDDATLSVGLAEEITTALARFRWINLIAPGSIAALATEPTGQTERWRGLDLDFLLDGTIQRSGGGQLRVTVRLLDMREGREVVWSQRFDRDSADLFTLQDEIAAETAAQVDPELILHESRRAAARPVRDATAYELMLRAIPAIYRLTEPGYTEAGDMLAQAAERAPDNATIHAWWACWHAFLVGQGWARQPDVAMRRAGELAERAVALDPSCARSVSIAAYVRSFLLHRDIAETIGLHDRALQLNPNMPFAWAASALTLTYAGDHTTAIKHALQAKRLSPFDPHSFFFDNALMVPSLMLGDFEAVVTAGRRSLALNPAMSSTCKGLLSALGHLGRTEDAAVIRGQLLRIEPAFTLASAAARSPLRREVDRAVYLDGLRLASAVPIRNAARPGRKNG